MSSRRGNRHAVALFIALVSVASIAPSAWTPALAATATISSAGPLTSIGISDMLNCSAYHTGGGHQFYGATACGTLLASGGTLYGPASIPAGGSAYPRTAWTPVSQSTVTGTGTTTDPFTVVTTVDGGASGLRVIETDSYAEGQDSYRTKIRVENSGTATADVVLYRAGDCYLGGSDFGYGFVIESVGAVACSKTADNSPADRVEQWVPITGGSSYYQETYYGVWGAIGTQAPFPNTCRCDDYIDNGAGLSWTLTIPAGGAATVSHITNFGLAAALSELDARAAIVDLSTVDPTGSAILSYSAKLTDAETGDPVAGATIEFLVNDATTCSATTNANGVASCESLTTALDVVQAGQYTALFSGDTDYLASVDTGALVAIDGTTVL